MPRPALRRRRAARFGRAAQDSKSARCESQQKTPRCAASCCRGSTLRKMSSARGEGRSDGAPADENDGGSLLGLGQQGNSSGSSSSSSSSSSGGGGGGGFSGGDGFARITDDGWCSEHRDCLVMRRPGTLAERLAAAGQRAAAGWAGRAWRGLLAGGAADGGGGGGGGGGGAASGWFGSAGGMRPANEVGTAVVGSALSGGGGWRRRRRRRWRR